METMENDTVTVSQKEKKISVKIGSGNIWNELQEKLKQDERHRAKNKDGHGRKRLVIDVNIKRKFSSGMMKQDSWIDRIKSALSRNKCSDQIASVGENNEHQEGKHPQIKKKKESTKCHYPPQSKDEKMPKETTKSKTPQKHNQDTIDIINLQMSQKRKSSKEHNNKNLPKRQEKNDSMKEEAENKSSRKITNHRKESHQKDRRKEQFRNEDILPDIELETDKNSTEIRNSFKSKLDHTTKKERPHTRSEAENEEARKKMKRKTKESDSGRRIRLKQLSESKEKKYTESTAVKIKTSLESLRVEDEDKRIKNREKNMKEGDSEQSKDKKSKCCEKSVNGGQREETPHREVDKVIISSHLQMTEKKQFEDTISEKPSSKVEPTHQKNESKKEHTPEKISSKKEKRDKEATNREESIKTKKERSMKLSLNNSPCSSIETLVPENSSCHPHVKFDLNAEGQIDRDLKPLINQTEEEYYSELELLSEMLPNYYQNHNLKSDNIFADVDSKSNRILSSTTSFCSSCGDQSCCACGCMDQNIQVRSYPVVSTPSSCSSIEYLRSYSGNLVLCATGKKNVLTDHIRYITSCLEL